MLENMPMSGLDSSARYVEEDAYTINVLNSTTMFPIQFQIEGHTVLKFFNPQQMQQLLATYVTELGSIYISRYAMRLS